MSTEYPEKVLFVDDDLYLLEALRRQFRRKFVVVVASGADEALKLVKTDGPIAVVVSDESMPGMSGCELLRKVRKLSPQTVRILFSGNVCAKAVVAAEVRADLFHILSKPSSRQTILSSVVAAINEHRSNCSETSDFEPTSLMFSSGEEEETSYASHR